MPHRSPRNVFTVSGILLLHIAVIWFTAALMFQPPRLAPGSERRTDTLATRLLLAPGTTAFPSTTVGDDPITRVERSISVFAVNGEPDMVRLSDQLIYRDIVTDSALWTSTTSLLVNARSGTISTGSTPEGYLFPPNTERISYLIDTLTHGSIPLTYHGDQQLLGVTAYLFVFDGRHSTLRSPRQLQGNQEVVCYDLQIRYWVEPTTGETIRFSEACPGGEWVVDRATDQRIAPLQRYTIETVGDDLVRNVALVQNEVLRVRWLTLYAPLLIATLGLAGLIYGSFARFILYRLMLPPLLNTFQFRIYAILALLIIVIVTLVVLGARTAETLESQNRIVDTATQLRTFSLQQTSLLRQLESAERAEREDEIAALRNQLNATSSTFSRLIVTLRSGDTRSNLRPLENEGFQAMLEQLNLRWEEYRSRIFDYMRQDMAMREELLPALDAQSQINFTLADRLVSIVDELATTTLSDVQRLYSFIGGVVAVILVAALFAVNRTEQSLRDLARTATRFAGGDLSARAQTQTVTEINRVGRVFNTMAEQITESIDRLRRLFDDANEARGRAERSDRVKSAFLASMSHELRTPLNAIINFTRFVADGEVGDINADQKEMLEDSLQSARHLLNLINDVLDMSKIEAGSLVLFLEDNVDVAPLIASAATAAQSLLNGKAVSVHTDINEFVVPIRADRQRVYQILLNLVSNACKFTERGEITLAAYRRDGELILTVADTGIGIARENLEAVFVPFQQTHDGLRFSGGTGLGLPISRSLAEAHGGRLWVESVLERGSTFYVVLPVRARTENVTTEIIKAP